MAVFAERVDAFLGDFFRLYPVAATAVGNHAFDGDWPDLSDWGQAERLAFIDDWSAELRAIPDGSLTPDERIDRDLLVSELAALRFDEADLREGSWDPLSYVYLIGGGIFPLLARDFEPLATRLGSVASRLERLPAVLTAARGQLGRINSRPVSTLHLEMALRQLPGIGSLVDDTLARASAAASDPAVAALQPRLEKASVAARRALNGFARYLRRDLRPGSHGDGRLGRDLFARKLRRTFRSNLTDEQILTQARLEYDAVRAEMIRIARRIWRQWLPGQPLPSAASEGSQEAADQKTVSRVTAAIGRAHHPAGELVQACRDSHLEILEFVRRKKLIGLPNEPLEIDWTPPFLREFAGAMLDSPGPLDKGQKSFYFVTPPPADWTAEQVESYLAEENDRQIALTTIHEGTPGHYLQLVYSNRCPSVVRAVFGSGVFVEGWAVYVTQVMMDMGFRADDPALLLIHWKFYLRAIINALLDVGIHAGSMTEAEAMELMVEGGFQEESEARKKWDRARLTSTQLSTYFVGSMEMWNLEKERRRRLAAASNDPRGASAVPEPRIVGGFGKTPGFTYGEHLEAVLAHGSPPIPLLRKVVLGE
ncbi:MAG: DUF885 domain-containing protein [Candidatus Limnocylindrales bacterium]|jgi:uncharacterized protein (DUF885 family)